MTWPRRAKAADYPWPIFDCKILLTNLDLLGVLDQVRIKDDNIIRMARPKKDPEMRKAMCERLVSVISQLDMSIAEISRELGYSNATTIRKVRRGGAFIDVERLYKLSKLKTPDGKHIDLHWLITGVAARGNKWI